jgi:hypothetical protein
MCSTLPSTTIPAVEFIYTILWLAIYVIFSPKVNILYPNLCPFERTIYPPSQTSPPVGRITLSTLPPRTSTTNTGPTTDIIDPISLDEIKADWVTFVENGGFREILQNVIKENIAQEEMVINDAKSLPGGDGWIHLCDERALPAYIPRFSWC